MSGTNFNPIIQLPSLQLLSTNEVPYSNFLPEVLPYVHDVAEFIALNAIRNACIEFCCETQYLLWAPNSIDGVANQPEYVLTPPGTYQISRVLLAWYDSLPLTPVDLDRLNELYSQDFRGNGGEPQYITQVQPNIVALVPYPLSDDVGGLNAIFAMEPTPASVTVDASIFNKYMETIGMGARARLLDTPDQPYYNPQSAMRYRTWFRSAMSKATIERSRGLGRRNPCVRPPYLV